MNTARFLTTALILVSFPALYSQEPPRKPQTEGYTYEWAIPADAGETLHGVLQLPASPDPAPVVVFVHGSGPLDRDGNAPQVRADYFKILADSLVSRGIGVVRYDKRTTRLKTAEQLLGFRFGHLVSDIDTIVSHFSKDARVGSLYLLGHSQGGLLVTLSPDTKVTGIICVSGTSKRIERTMIRQACAQDSLNCSLIRNMIDMARKPLDSALEASQRIQLSMLSEWMAYDPLEAARAIEKPVLVIGGGKDLQIPAAEAQELNEAFPDSELAIIPDMNHVMKTIEEDAYNLASYWDPAYPLSVTLVKSIHSFVVQNEGNH